MVERHQVRFIDKEMAMIRELAGTDDFLLACVRVVDCNEDLTPWVAPGIFGNSDFSGRGPQTLDYLLKEMIPMILHERDLALAGAVCGDHCSPISDTTIMASAGANVNHIDHVSTQLPYALTVAGVSFVCYLIAGFVQSWALCLVIGAALTVGVLFFLRSRQKTAA